MSKIEIYFDGSCPDNPHGFMGYGYVVDMNGTEIHQGFSGEAARVGNSCNVAEYKALSLVLSEIQQVSNQKIIIYGDSKLVIKQMRGEYKIGHGLYRDSALVAQKLLMNVIRNNHVELRWIPREKNTRADIMSNTYHETF